MTATAEIRPLRRDDDRSDFSCGQADLDRFFQHYAGQNQFKHGLCVSYVAVVAECIVGFATAVAGVVERRNVPSKRLRRRLPAYPLPVLRLARLGVDIRAQGMGVGRRLLSHVLRLALLQRDASGCVGVVVDAKPDAIEFYRSLGFVELEGVRQGEVHGGVTPLFLPIAAVVESLEGTR